MAKPPLTGRSSIGGVLQGSLVGLMLFNIFSNALFFRIPVGELHADTLG